jgi:hypothetical protein
MDFNELDGVNWTGRITVLVTNESAYENEHLWPNFIKYNTSFV